jgi:hypothetical protein
MSCDLRCEHRILIEDRVSVSQLVSLDVLRERVPPRRLKHLRDRVCAASSLTEAEFNQDPFGASVEWSSWAGKLPLFVCDQSREHAYRIRPSAIDQGCSCWSVSELVRDGIFAPKVSRMLNRSLEVLLDGQPAYARQNDFTRALELRPPSQKIIGATVGKVINDAVEGGKNSLTTRSRLGFGRTPTVGTLAVEAFSTMLKSLSQEDGLSPGRSGNRSSSKPRCPDSPARSTQ